jgi:hypothetical protein
MTEYCHGARMSTSTSPTTDPLPYSPKKEWEG